ncbi:MAG: aminoacyl-tRNA hydrolase [Patescibacteria group bacterium]
MSWIIAGLGNPDRAYEGTRHNVGRDFVQHAEGKISKKAKLVTPEVYMNNSGPAIRKILFAKSAQGRSALGGKAASRLVVVHDDLDLPLGTVKISFGSGSGGHRGVESIIKALKTKEFVRLRIGISPSTPSGKLKKPESSKIVDFVLGKFKPAEQEKLKKVKKLVHEALELILEEGLEKAQTTINSR